MGSLQRVCTLDSLCTAARRPTSPSATACPSATCLREPLCATLRRRPVTVASLPGLRATTQLSSPTTPTPRGPGSSCPPAPRRYVHRTVCVLRQEGPPLHRQRHAHRPHA